MKKVYRFLKDDAGAITFEYFLIAAALLVVLFATVNVAIVSLGPH